MNGYNASKVGSEWLVSHDEGTLTYTAAGATLTVSCSDSNHGSHTASLILTPSDTKKTFESDGSIGWKNGQTIGFSLSGEDSWKKLLGEVDIPEIYYEGTGTTTYTKTTTEPTEEGTYKATFSQQTATAYVNFSIRIVYTVSFNANGGRSSMPSKEIEKGQYTLPICKIKPPRGKEFDGWSLTQNGPEESSSINLVSNITLFAKWKQHEHQLTTSNLGNGMTKMSCDCGFYILKIE